MSSKYTVFTAYLLAAVFLAGCAGTEPSPQPVEQATDTAPQVTEAEVVDDYDGDGLDLPLDGSSKEAFDASLARIKRHTDAASYKTLTSSFGYLLMYDLPLRGDKEKLIKKLDGKTGYEVFDMVEWLDGIEKEDKPANKDAAAATVET